MAVAAATNCLTKAEDALRDMIANTAAFQTWVSAADAAAAKASLYYDSLPQPTDDVYTKSFWTDEGNFAVLYTADDDGFAFDFESISAGYNYLASGVLMVDFFHLFALTPIDFQEDHRTAKNQIGDVLEDLIDLGGTNPYLNFTACEVVAYGWPKQDQEPATCRQFWLRARLAWDSGNVAG